MKSIFNDFFRIISLKNINIRQYRYQHNKFPAVFVIGKPSVKYNNSHYATIAS